MPKEHEKRDVGFRQQHLALLVPNHPDEVAMSSRCQSPFCREPLGQTPDPKGIAAIALHDRWCKVEPHNPLISISWGHWNCIYPLFERRATGLAPFAPEPDIGTIAVNAIETRWHVGIQRGMLDFIARYPEREIVVDYAAPPIRPRVASWRWRLADSTGKEER
jgi:hypothetical protein